MPAAPIVFGREFFEVDPRSTALIVIDMQNAFVAEGATYETPPARTMLRRCWKRLRPQEARNDPGLPAVVDPAAPARLIRPPG